MEMITKSLNVKMAASIFVGLMLFMSTASAGLGSQKFPSIDFRDDITTEAEKFVTDTYYGDPGILPDSPIYFLKKLGEQIRLALAFNPEQREKLHLEFAGTRLAEARAMIKNNKADHAKSALEEFADELVTITPTSDAAADRKQALRKGTILIVDAVGDVPEEMRPAFEETLDSIGGIIPTRPPEEKPHEDEAPQPGIPPITPSVEQPVIDIPPNSGAEAPGGAGSDSQGGSSESGSSGSSGSTGTIGGVDVPSLPL